MITPPLSASAPKSVEDTPRPASQTPQPPANRSAAAGAGHPPLLLERRRLKLGERAGEGLRFNAQLPTLGDRMASLLSPRLLPADSPLSTSSPSPGPKTFPSPSSSLAALLDPPTPVARHRSSESWNAAMALGKERRLQSVMRSTSPGVVLSPRLVRKLSQQSSAPNLTERLAALKPGAAEISNGFTAVALEPARDGEALDSQGMRRLGKGAAGTAYAVRLAENFWRDGKDCGRDFVFKTMLCTDPANPLSRKFYDALLKGTDSLADAIEKEKARIYKEYQVASSLGDTAQVMRVHGLVQIGALFGILAEQIEGPTVHQVIDWSRQALQQQSIEPLDYLALGRQMVADVLIGAARFADEGVVHQDISHNNVLYDERQKMFRLIDMGLGSEEGEPVRMGTKGYFEMRPSASEHKRDVYSVAQLLVHFLKSPDYPMGLIGINQASSAETLPFMDALKALPAGRKAEIVQLITRMISKNPDERASAEELLQDPFFGEMPPRDDVHAIYQRLSSPA